MERKTLQSFYRVNPWLLKEARAAVDVLGLVSETGGVSRKCRFSKADLRHQGSFFLTLASEWCLLC